MGSRNTCSSLALFLCLNLVFFALAGATYPANPFPSSGKCPRDQLKLGVCADVLNLVKNVVVGAPPTLPCCALLEGLVNLEAALCLCTAIKANILGINLNLPIALSLVLNNCGKTVPNGFECT
ncbi:14 kDa proline-rich protein DC2.15-like [Apium graveolens]|uniref:14 kDa proline-rich protein DC2.15-like n=1 Tax=Apium graveolens TaxID=4045 RepID=UPI003D79A6A7